MSNFVCPTCGFTNIDCGKVGYKTEREIKLEKDLAGGLEREKIHLKRALEAEKKLDIAMRALEEIQFRSPSCYSEYECPLMNDDCYCDSYSFCSVKIAHEALKEIN